MKKQHVQLTPEHREQLKTITDQGMVSGRQYKRALALQELDRGKTYTEVAKTVGVRSVTLSTLAAKYKNEGLACLNDKPRPGRPPEISGGAIAKITALACSTPPEGYSQWSLRLLAEKVVQLEYVEAISHTEVARILKKTTSSHTSIGNGVLAK